MMTKHPRRTSSTEQERDRSPNIMNNFDRTPTTNTQPTRFLRALLLLLGHRTTVNRKTSTARRAVPTARRTHGEHNALNHADAMGKTREIAIAERPAARQPLRSHRVEVFAEMEDINVAAGGLRHIRLCRWCRWSAAAALAAKVHAGCKGSRNIPISFTAASAPRAQSDR